MVKAKKFWTYENKLVTIFFFTLGFVFFDRLAINYLFPMMQADLNLTYTHLGLLGAALALTWSISGPLGGYISDKVKSKKRMLALLVLLFSVISLLHGLAQTFAMLFVLRLLMGIVEGPLVPQTQSIMAMESSEKRRGFNLGFTMNTGNAVFGSLIAPIVIIALANAFDWHTAFYLTIIPGIILSIVILKVMRNPAKIEPKTASEPTEKVKIGSLLKQRNIWLSIVIFSAFMTLLMAFQIFGPTYLMQVKGLSSTSMSIAMSVFGLSFAIFGVLVPSISDRAGRKIVALIFGFIFIFVPLVIIYVDSFALMLVLLFITGAGTGVGAMAMSIIPTESVSLKYSGLVVGLTIGIGEFFGGFLNPLINGRLADIYGGATPLYVGAAAGLIAFIFSFFLKETLPSKVSVKNDDVKPADDVTPDLNV